MARIEPSKPAQKQRPGYGAGSEGWDGSEDPSRPVVSSDERIAQENPANATAPGSTQSDYALSQPADQPADDGRFSVAEEVSLDMASDSARQVGTLSHEDSKEMGETMRSTDTGAHKAAEEEALRQAMERNVPPSE